jgi:hypothetical protein
MASIRSISSAKPSERLLTGRSTRTSTTFTPLSQTKSTPPKTTPFTVTTIKRHKSSRMASKKGSIASITSSASLSSFPSTTTTTADNNELINKMASATINDLPPMRPTSRMSNSTSTASNMRISQSDSDSVFDNKPIDEPLNGHLTSTTMREKITSSSSSRKSSTQDIQFTINSFDIIRTVGTGKTFRF